MAKAPLVSICMITYNHKAYIKQAIEGVLMQQTNFKIEFIIADDCSTDQMEIDIRELIKSQPDNSYIKYFRHERNLGMMPNFIFALQQCTGKYIALCEGDDYWTDPLKLQKQVDFLEGNQAYVAVATNSKVVYEKRNKKPHLFKNDIKNILHSEDFLGKRHFHTATYLFKKKYFLEDFPNNVLSGDRVLFLLVSGFGKTKVLDDVTAVYRKNLGGISSKVDSGGMLSDFNMVPYLKKYDPNLNVSKLKSFIATTVISYSHKIKPIHFLRASFILIFNNIKIKKGLKNGLKSILNDLSFLRKNIYKARWL